MDGQLVTWLMVSNFRDLLQEMYGRLLRYRVGGAAHSVASCGLQRRGAVPIEPRVKPSTESQIIEGRGELARAAASRLITT